MPRIPTYSSQLSARVGGAPPVGDVSQVNRALVGLGKTVSEIGKRFERAREVLEYNENMRELQEELTNTKFSFAERQDFQNFEPEFRSISEEIRKKYYKRMENNSLFPQFQARLEGLLNSTYVTIRSDARRKQIYAGRASYFGNLDKLADLYGKASDVEKNAIIKQVEEMTELNVESGYITPVEAQEKIKEFKYNALKSDAWHTAYAMGEEEGIKWLMNEKNVPKLRREDRSSMIAELRRNMNIKRAEQKRKEKELNNAVFESFLERIIHWEEGEGSLPSGVEIVESPMTDPKMKQQLISYIDSVEKEKNPFRNSDPKVYGEVFTSVVINPQEWSPEKIISYMGKGLSSRDTYEALKLYKSLTVGETPPKTHSKLRMALDILDRAAKEGMFIGKDLKTEATDKEIINNYAMHARAVSELIRRAEEGEDPVQVAQELMKPIVDRKVEGWFTRMWNRLFRSGEEKERILRERAIEELQEEGALITEETIAAKMKELEGEEEEEK